MTLATEDRGVVRTKQSDGLEKLVSGHVLPARFHGISDHIRPGLWWDPVVVIIDPKDGRRTDYFGNVIPSQHHDTAIASAQNKLRDMLWTRRKRADDIHVYVIGLCNDAESPAGHYKFIATDAPLSMLLSPEAIANRSVQVVASHSNISYARYSYEGINGDPCLQVYLDGRVIKGILTTRKESLTHPPINGSLSLESGNVEQISSFQGIKIGKMKLGDYLLVRAVAETASARSLMLNPLINFLDSDEAYDPSGRKLVTRVSEFSPGGIIYDLPILNTVRLANRDKVRVGYILTPDRGYIPVQVWCHAQYRGSYIPKIEITGIAADRIDGRVICP